MNARLNRLLLLAALAALPLAGRAIDAPHDAADASNSACYYCHSLATVMPSGSTDFTQACLGCHNKPGHTFGSPWTGTDEAVPGTTGFSHSWSGNAISIRYESKPVVSFADQALQVDGRLQCVVCHDPHTHNATVDPNSMHTSIPVAPALVDANGNSLGQTIGTAKLSLTAPLGSASSGFRVQVQTVTGTGGTFIISHTYAYDLSKWVVWSPGTSTWVAGTSTGEGRPYTNSDGTAATDVALDIAGIKVRISAGAAVGDHWDFYVGYPFTRYSNVDDAICLVCHKSREMNHVRARGLDLSYKPDGVKKFSHPIGVPLNVNGFNTDQTVILDADGTPGDSESDGLVEGVPTKNASNNLVLGSAAAVRCTTCHAAHNSDSNSLTVDVR